MIVKVEYDTETKHADATIDGEPTALAVRNPDSSQGFQFTLRNTHKLNVQLDKEDEASINELLGFESENNVRAAIGEWFKNNEVFSGRRISER